MKLTDSMSTNKKIKNAASYVALSLLSFIIESTIGVAISAMIASITITANNSINVKPLFFIFT